jgi:NADPH2:quinone reductase
MTKVCETAVINAPTDEVWRILRDFNSHEIWHPAIAESHIEDGHPADQVGAIRAFSLADGGVLREQLIRLDDRKRSFSYCLLEAPLPLFDYVATVTLRPVTETGQTFWKWESQFRTPLEREAELRSLVANDIYLAGMRALERWLGRHNLGELGTGGATNVERRFVETPAWTPQSVPEPRTSTRTGAIRTRAIVMQRFGGPEVLEFKEVDAPAPKLGEIRIRQTAIGVNFIDIYCRTGYFDLVTPPGVPGMEAAGTVEDIGEGVTGFEPGDRVAYACAPTGAYTAIRTMPADLVVHLPASVPEEIAAAGLLKGITAGFLLHDVHLSREGETAVIHAAAGGVGSLLVQWALSLGVHVIATVSSNDKVARVRELGAGDVIIGRGPEFVEAVMDITNGRGADVIYDAIGRDSFDSSLDSLAIRGHLVSYGQASGDIGPRDIGALASRSVTLSRPNYGHYTGTPELMQMQTTRLFDNLERGMLAIDQPTMVPLAEAAEVHRLLESGQTTGSVVLRP